MSDELVEWLRAQIAEDERLARHALEWASSPWVGAFKQVTSEPEGSIKTVASTNSAQVSHHIERWEPEAVLAEVEAKRRILDAYDDDRDRVTFGEFESCSDSCPGYVMRQVLRLLAWPYRDRGGFRDEWRP